MKIGIEESKKIILFITQISNQIAGSLSPKSGLWAWLKLSYKILIPLTSFLTVDFDNAKSEFNDLDRVEKQELYDIFKDNLKLPQYKVERIAETLFGLMMDIFMSIKEIVTILKNAKNGN